MCYLPASSLQLFPFHTFGRSTNIFNFKCDFGFRLRSCSSFLLSLFSPKQDIISISTMTDTNSDMPNPNLFLQGFVIMQEMASVELVTTNRRLEKLDEEICEL
jgi:hypothetical protein